MEVMAPQPLPDCRAAARCRTNRSTMAEASTISGSGTGPELVLCSATAAAAALWVTPAGRSAAMSSSQSSVRLVASALRSASWVSEETFRPADLASAARSSGR